MGKNFFLKLKRKELFLFLYFSLFKTLFTFLIYQFLLFFVNYLFSYIISFVFGLIYSYRKLQVKVFFGNHSLIKFMYFSLFYLASLSISIQLLKALILNFSMNERIAPLFVIAILFFPNYILSKKLLR
jgi:hypothetical protein